MTELPSALAVIDGTLSQLARNGVRARFHAPLATAVVEFKQGPMCVYVRENPYGLLPGISNLYCVDGDLRLQWLAEWPTPENPCVKILEVTAGSLVAESTNGDVMHFDAHTGRLQGVSSPMAVAS